MLHKKFMRCDPPQNVDYTELGPAAAGADAVVRKDLGGCSRIGTPAARVFNMQKEVVMNYGFKAPVIPLGRHSSNNLQTTSTDLSARFEWYCFSRERRHCWITTKTKPNKHCTKGKHARDHVCVLPRKVAESKA